VAKISRRRRSSSAEGRASTIVPLVPFMQVAAPVLHAMPLPVSRSDSFQTAASSFGSSAFNRAFRSAGSAFQASVLAPKTARPQLMGMV